MNLVEAITNRYLTVADEILKEELDQIVLLKLNEAKKRVAADLAGQMYIQTERQRKLRMDVLEDKEEPKVTQGTEQQVAEEDDEDDGNSEQRKIISSKQRDRAMGTYDPSKYPQPPKDPDEDKDSLHEARVAIVKARIRGGKIQRRKKVSNVPGFTLRGGQLTRMSAAERRRRKLGAKKAARKSRMKKTQMLRKRRMSLMKRQRLGI